MKRASNILLKIAHIFGIVMAVFCFITAVSWIIISFMPEMRDALVQTFEENGVDFGELSAEQVVFVGQLIIASCAVAFLYLGIVCIVDAVVSKKAMDNPTKGRLIACMILGLMCTDFSFVGGLLGIFALAKENRQKKIEE